MHAPTSAAKFLRVAFDRRYLEVVSYGDVLGGFDMPIVASLRLRCVYGPAPRLDQTAIYTV